MKDKIVNILKESDRSLDAIEIMNKINSNYGVEDLKNLLGELNELYLEGIIYQRNDNKYLLFEKSNLKKGYMEIASKGYGFVLNEPEDLYVPICNLNGANDGDFVIAELCNNKGKKKEYRILRILKRGLDNSLGEIIVDSKGKFNIKPLRKVNYEIELILNNENIVEGEIVRFEIIKEISKRKYQVGINKVVGHKNSPDIDTLKIVEEFNIVSQFSEEALAEAKNMPLNINNEDKKNRKDIRNEVIFTIDGSDTKDIDDAISLELLENGNYKLGVHIADVSYYVRDGSVLKKEAFDRGNSVYLADRVIPMLPVELSNGICSLNPSVDRFTTSCVMEVNNKGEVVNYDIFKGIITSKKKMNYESVNKIFNNEVLEDYKYLEYTINETDTKESICFRYGMDIVEFDNINGEFKAGEIVKINTINILNNMLRLSKILNAYKKRRGMLDFLSSEVKLKVNEEGKVIEILKRTQGLGEELIEDFMIVANETVATHINNMQLPFIYRVHSNPSPLKLKEFVTFVSILGYSLPGKIHYESIMPREVESILEQLKDKKEYEILNKKLLRCMSKAIYDPINIGHFGLASPCYTHFTSPIRRYSDLMVHYFIDEYLFKNNITNDICDKYNSSLPLITDHISKTERDAENCEYEVNDMKIAEYMEGHIGEEYTARIDGCLTNGFFVETDNLISGFVALDTYPEYLTYKEELMAYTGKKNRVVFRLGDRVKVSCISASKENRTVDFMIVSDKNGNS